MYPAVISLFLLGITMMLTSLLPGFGSSYDAAYASSLARNFSMYREAVADHLADHPDALGIHTADLTLPEGYRPLADWRTSIAGESCYVYGTPGHEVDLPELIRLSGEHSGMNRAGRLQPSGTSLPSTIPDGAVVGIIRITHD